MHRGVDIPAPSGTPIGAADEGTVSDTGYEPGGAGKFVKIRHNASLSTKYFHLSWIDVSRGQRVTTGQTIGRVGATGNASGPHLHFEVWHNGAAVDPAAWI
jgi:murein DD-endopeptidase MepM/ murein hydrolase activator NlpD